MQRWALGLRSTMAYLPAMSWHHLPDGTFRNPQGSPTPGGTRADWRAFLYRRLLARLPTPVIPEGHVLPEDAVLAGIAAAAGADSITWLGHACFLIRLRGHTLLTDPYLTDRASPLPWFGPRRFAGPGLAPERLPPIDVLLLSHNHYDHLDLRTLARLADTSRTAVVMPLGLSRYVDASRFAAATELDWLQRAEIADLAITAVPAIHASKRSLRDRNASLWCGFHLQAAGRSVLFTGDTAYGPVFGEVAPLLPAPDLALVPIGAYDPRPLMQGSHCTPEEGVRIGCEWGAKRLCGMHWGTIRLTDEPVFEPPARFKAAAADAGYGEHDAWTLAIGETRSL